LSLDESRASLARAGVDFRTLPPAEMRPVAFGRWFSGIEAPPRLADLERICAQFRPDAIVHEVAELAGPLAASLAGIPWATVGFGPLLQPDVADIAGEGVAPLWRAKGLAPAPDFINIFTSILIRARCRSPRSISCPQSFASDRPAAPGEWARAPRAGAST
jgi:hypothetical protein